MKNKKGLSVIAVVWGGGLIIYGFLNKGINGSVAYDSGKITGFIFGTILCIVGLYNLFRSSHSN